MIEYLKKLCLLLLIFIVSFIGTGISYNASEGHLLVDQLGLPRGVGLILSFLFMFLISSISLWKFRKRNGTRLVLVIIAIPIVFLLISNSINYTINAQLKILPFYISWTLGVVAGFLYSSKSKKKIQVHLMLAIFPILMTFNVYELWVHKIEYGNWTGEVVSRQASPFEMENKAGEVVNNELLYGKVILFDFWFISCPPCWKKFPDLQRVHEKYKNNPDVEIYAVNRPMRSDHPNALFERIEDKGYSFPVLRGTQEVMDAFDVYKYPTVIILDRNGEIVFMGELEDAERKLESMLNQ